MIGILIISCKTEKVFRIIFRCYIKYMITDVTYSISGFSEWYERSCRYYWNKGVTSERRSLWVMMYMFPEGARARSQEILFDEDDMVDVKYEKNHVRQLLFFSARRHTRPFSNHVLQIWAFLFLLKRAVSWKTTLSLRPWNFNLRPSSDDPCTHEISWWCFHLRMFSGWKTLPEAFIAR